MGRVLDLPYARCDAIAKMIPGDLGMTLDKALKQARICGEAYQSDDEVRYLIDSQAPGGPPRHTSMHAAGVVIGQRAMDEFVPLSRASDGTITDPVYHDNAGRTGPAQDGLSGPSRTLTVIQNAVCQAEENYGVHLVMEEIDYNDKEVLASIGTGKCDGIFQLESSGMKSFMKRAAPGESGGYHCGYFPVSSGPYGFYSPLFKRKERQRFHHL